MAHLKLTKGRRKVKWLHQTYTCSTQLRITMCDDSSIHFNDHIAAVQNVFDPRVSVSVNMFRFDWICFYSFYPFETFYDSAPYLLAVATKPLQHLSAQTDTLHWSMLDTAEFIAFYGTSRYRFLCCFVIFFPERKLNCSCTRSITLNFF